MYLNHPAEPGCSGIFVAYQHCCVIGTFLLSWIEGEWDCFYASEACFYGYTTTQRIVWISEGYDNEPDCQAELA